MSDFINRLEQLQSERNDLVTRKARLGASVEIYQVELDKAKKELEDKGFEYENVEELVSEISELEHYLNDKITRLEQNISGTSTATESVSTPTQSTQTTQTITPSVTQVPQSSFDLGDFNPTSPTSTSSLDFGSLDLDGIDL